MTIRLRWIGMACLAMAGLMNYGSTRRPERRGRRGAWSVRAVLDRQVADWNKGDLDGFLDGYWNSPKVVFQSGGQRHDGFEAMRDRYRRRYQAEGKAMGRLRFHRSRSSRSGPEAMLAQGRLAADHARRSQDRAGLFTLILRKFPAGWKIVHDHTSAEEPAPPKPAEKKTTAP